MEKQLYSVLPNDHKLGLSNTNLLSYSGRQKLKWLSLG